MNALILIFTALFLPAAHAANEAEDECDQLIFSRPEAQDSVNAARVFSYRLKSAGCALREKIKLTKEQYIYIQSFERNGRLVYEVTDFADKPATTKTCVVTQHMIRPTGPGPILAIARFEYGEPSCTKKTEAK